MIRKTNILFLLIVIISCGAIDNNVDDSIEPLQTSTTASLLTTTKAQDSTTTSTTTTTTTTTSTSTTSTTVPTSTTTTKAQDSTTTSTTTTTTTTSTSTTSTTVPTSTTTTTVLSTSYPQLVIREVSSSIPIYDRDDWSHWSDDDGDCQNVRHEVLQDETFETVTFTTSSNCYVDTGKWYGVYTATYYYSASELDVDHFVPLKNAHDSGGYEWSLSKKKEYANFLEDSDHLIAVQSSANRSKGANGPDNWKPENTDYWCEYAYDWIRIKDTWGLTATQSEWDALVSMIVTCPAGYTYQDAVPEPLVTVPTTTTTTTTITTTTTTTIPTTTTTIPDNPGDIKNCSDFETYQEAKTWFDTYFPYYGDVAGLDGDGDQEPCESLPGSP